MAKNGRCSRRGATTPVCRTEHHELGVDSSRYFRNQGHLIPLDDFDFGVDASTAEFGVQSFSSLAHSDSLAKRVIGVCPTVEHISHQSIHESRVYGVEHRKLRV